MKLIITGDKSRYQFFRELINMSGYKEGDCSFSTEILSRQSLMLVSNKNMIKEKEEIRYVFSSKIPLHTFIFFPREGLNEFRHYGMEDRVLIFDEFPFQTESDMYLLDVISEQNPLLNIQVVLYCNRRKMLESDISTEASAIQDAYNSYQARGVNTCVYTPGGEKKFMFWEGSTDKEKYKEDLKIKLHKVSEKMDMSFQLEYEITYQLEIENKISDISILEELVRYRTGYNGQIITDIYYKNAYQYCFHVYRQWMDAVLGLYDKIIQEIRIWDKTRDFAKLEAYIEKEFKNKFKKMSKLTFNGDEIEYILFRNEHHIDIQFKKVFVDFFEKDLCSIIENYIKNKIRILERLMK